MLWGLEACDFIPLIYVCFSCRHIPTNGIAPLSAYKPTYNPHFSIRSNEGLTLEMLAFLFVTVANLQLFQLSWYNQIDFFEVYLTL